MPGIASFATHHSADAAPAFVAAATSSNHCEIDAVLCTAAPSLTARNVAQSIGASRSWTIDLCPGCVATQTALKLAADLTTADRNIRRALVVTAAAAALIDRNAPANEILASAWIGNGSADSNTRAQRVSINHLLTAIECAITDSGYTLTDLGFLVLPDLQPATREFLVDALDLEEDQAAAGADALVSLERASLEQLIAPGTLVVLAAADPPHSWAATCIRWG